MSANMDKSPYDAFTLDFTSCLFNIEKKYVPGIVRVL